MLTVSASHTSEKWTLDCQPFAVVELGEFGSSYRVGGSAEHGGFYAIAPNFGCGRSCSTPQAAIRDLLLANGCTAVVIAESSK